MNLFSPEKLYSRDEVLSHASPVPRDSGVYGWFFREVPPKVPVDECFEWQGLKLLYIGIAPKAPPKYGRSPTKQRLFHRIRYHYRGNAEGSTLRLTLGCLLAEELGIQLRRVGSGKRMTFTDGEARLSEWLTDNAFVTWVVHPEPGGA